MDKKEIEELGNTIVTLQREAVKQTLLYWKPEAEKIISTKSKDNNAIEHTLDALCEAAFDDEVLIVLICILLSILPYKFILPLYFSISHYIK